MPGPVQDGSLVRSFVEPASLYRYRPLQEFEREIGAIEQGYLHCASFIDLNDPMEGEFTAGRRFRRSPEYRQIRSDVLDRKRGLRLCSFSEVPNHELMWAHYADQFRGMCVSYSFSKLMRNYVPPICFVRMFYNDNQPTIHTADRSPDDLAKMVLSYKNYRWLYEREWRMFSRIERNVYVDIRCVRSVRLGARIPSDQKTEITHRLTELGIKVRCMTIKKYRIRFDTEE